MIAVTPTPWTTGEQSSFSVSPVQSSERRTTDDLDDFVDLNNDSRDIITRFVVQTQASRGEMGIDLSMW